MSHGNAPHRQASLPYTIIYFLFISFFFIAMWLSNDELKKLDNKQLMAIGDEIFDKMFEIYKETGSKKGEYHELKVKLDEIRDIMVSNNYNRRGK